MTLPHSRIWTWTGRRCAGEPHRGVLSWQVWRGAGVQRPQAAALLQRLCVSKIADVMIAGRWVAPSGGETRIVTCPSTLRPVGSVRTCDESQWQTALRAAHIAAASAPRSAEERATLLTEVGERLLAHQRELALLHARESGQVLAESLEMVRRAAACWRVAASATMSPATLAAAVCLVRPRPDAALLDWSRIAAERLAHGVSCVAALPAQAPLTVLRAARACEGFPHGALSVLVGEPAAVDDSVECVRSTDGLVASDIVYVSRDADLQLAVAGAAARRLYHSGQRAEQSVRVYVERSLIYTLADRLHEYIAFLEAGDAAKPATDLGPLASAARLKQVETQVAGALRRGAMIKLGGRRYHPWGLTGYFFQPTLMIEGTGEERALDDQIRGPVIILAPARDLGAALADRPGTAPVRISLFAADAERALAAVNTGARRVQIDRIEEPGEDWFPYEARIARAARE